MYYYIFDIKRCKNSVITDIKDYLSGLGISGEFVYPSTAYTTEDLVELGLSKKYNTIVGIGGDQIANKIAGKLVGRSEAMGFIPIDGSEELKNLIDAKNWKEACENLRYRKIIEIRIGKTATGSVFMTNLFLDLKSPADLTIEFKDYIIQGKIKNLMISNYNSGITKIGEDYLDIVIQSVDPKERDFLGKLSSIIGLSKEEEKSFSMLRARSLRVFAKNQIPLICASESIAKTPQLIESSDENLRLIVGKRGAFSLSPDLK